jgi:murein DD-endopeptidase MepM/ murein hydrolase activator NlpD
MPRRLSSLVLIWLALASLAGAAGAGELENQIVARRAEIARLEAEIVAQQKNLDAASGRSKTLQGEIKNLDASLKQLNSQIKLTDQKISEATLTLEQLGLKIKSTETEAEKRQAELNESLRRWRMRDNESLPELLLSYPTLSSFWQEGERSSQLQARVLASTDALERLSVDLGAEQAAERAEQEKLTNLKAELKDRQKIANDSKATRQQLLTDTKNQESKYTALIKDLGARRDAFASEIFDLESKLKVTIDPASLPPAGAGILAWPLDDVFITQRFGKTVDAKRLYVSGTHSGVDFRATVGTPIKAAAGGVVIGAGDTDLQCRGASYGRWVLVRHANGLATLYGHLSLIKVTEGQNVTGGQVIGYSGKTGYATGPHLHFAVFAAAAVKVDRLASKSCAGAVFQMPIAPPNGYLDPLLYL